MDSDDLLDDELALCEDYGLDAKRIDGVVHAEWDGRWLPVDLSEEPPRPERTTLITATYDPGSGFMADEASYELGKVDASTIVAIDRIDGASIEVNVWDFEPGTEEKQIEAFMSQIRELQSDDPDSGARVTFFRGP